MLGEESVSSEELSSGSVVGKKSKRNGVSGSSLVWEVLGEESLSDSVEDEVSNGELSSGSVVGESNIVGEESEKVVEDSAVCRSSETTPECAAKLIELLELPRVQQTQKVQQYDAKSKEPKLSVGSRVMVHMQGEVQGKAWKLARPFHGPYRVIALTPNNVEVSLIDKPKDQSIFISLNRIRLCYDEMEDTTWTGPKKKRKQSKREEQSTVSTQPLISRKGPTTRSMTRVSAV